MKQKKFLRQKKFLKKKGFAILILWSGIVSGVGTTIASPSEWSVESFDSQGLLLKWNNPSVTVAFKTQGVTAAIALPPSSTASANFESVENFDSHSKLTGSVFMSPPIQYRDVTIAALTWNFPLIANSTRAPLSAKIRIHFNFAAANNLHSAFAAPLDNPAERALSNWILNYAQSRNLRSAAMSALGKISGLNKISGDGPSMTASLAKQRLVIKTQGENIEALSYDDLSKANVPLNKIDPRMMHLYRDGVEVAMYVQGEDDGVWNSGDYLEFIGQRAQGSTSYNSLYTNTATFILTWEGGRRALRAPRVPSASHSGGIIPIEVEASHRAKPFKMHAHIEMDNEILRIEVLQ